MINNDTISAKRRNTKALLRKKKPIVKSATTRLKRSRALILDGVEVVLPIVRGKGSRTGAEIAKAVEKVLSSKVEK